MSPRRPAPPAALALAVLSLAGCAGHRAPASPPPPLVIEAPALLPLTGSTLTLHAEQVRRLAPVRWSVTPGERAWIAPDGTLTLLEPGDVAVHATDGWRTGTRTFAVQGNRAAQVVMQERVVARAAPGDTVRVLGHVYGEDGARIPDAPVAYALAARGDAPPAATVTADGRFVAGEPGVYTVVAECGRVSGRTIVIVEGPEERAARELLAARARMGAGGPPRDHDGVDPAIDHHPDSAYRGDSAAGSLAAVRIAATRTARVAIDDTDAEAYEGTTLALAARVWVEGERRPDTTAQVAWTSSDPRLAYVTQAGRVVFLAPGRVTITAIHGGVAAERRFNVRWLPAVRLALRPGTPDVRVGQPVRFREDLWAAGAIPVVDARVNYAIIAHGSEGPVPATLTERRVFTALRPGVYTIIAEAGGVADKFTVLVRDGAVATR